MKKPSHLFSNIFFCMAVYGIIYSAITVENGLELRATGIFLASLALAFVSLIFRGAIK